MRNAGPKTPPGADIPGINAQQLTTPRSQPPADGSPPQVPDYELLRRIGGGSYGEVWLARSVLGTWRAVKIVYRSSFDHERPFEREFEGIQKFEPISRAHDSQVDILHVGKGDGCFYYVMELADDANVGQASRLSPPAENDPTKQHGPREIDSSSSRGTGATPVLLSPESYVPRTLKLDLQRRGRLPPNECVQIGLALTTALTHLHEHGLVHRDVKPSNIIFVDRRAKLADIGLVTSVDATRSFVGTEGYLPPEGAGTPQADLYSLGKVLYEMSTGQDRRHFPALPPDVAQLPDTPGIAELNAIVVKACQLDPRLRYQSVAEMQADLALLQRGQSVKRKRAAKRRFALASRITLATAVLTLFATGVWLLATRFNASTFQRFNASAPAELNSIAVLPFVNESKYGPHEYVSDALTVETINALTNCAGLRVAPRPAVFAFKRATNDLRQIGEQLGVRTVLAGSMKKSSNQLHIATRLVNVADGTQLWSASFDREVGDISVIQSEVVRQIGQQLNLFLDDRVLRQLETNLARKLRAYQRYSQARAYSGNTQDGFNKVTQLLNGVIAEDPDFAQAYADLAYWYQDSTGWLLPPTQSFPEAKKNALRALQLDDSLPRAHLTLASVFLNYELKPDKAEAEYHRAIEVDPRHAESYALYGSFLAYLGRFDETEGILKQGEQIDSRSHILHVAWCNRYYLDRDFTNFLQAATRLLALDSNSVVGFLWQAKAYERLGRYDKALELAQKMKQLDPGPDFVAFLGLIHARMRRQDEARQALEELRVMAQVRRGSPMYDAQVLLGLGEKDRAIEHLQRAVDDYPALVFVLNTDPFWDELRSDPRFAELLNKVGVSK